ncbi:MAG TPA: hypothetical protein PKL78_02565 [Anaerolineales bacterium]|nr:hypothetical protein [Anaerolineales bacterium]HNO30799.1 hypothetical protein [Anaerolineales bacterium]
MKRIFLTALLLALAACSVPVDAPPFPTALPAESPLAALPPAETFTQTSPPTAVPSFCEDHRPRDLIQTLQMALQTKDGTGFATLVSPFLGVNVTYIRNGNTISYDVEHAKFIFESTFPADWGLAVGSGEAVVGSFQDIVLPSLQQVFTADATLACGEIQTGGVTYIPQWPYPEMGYYSVHFPGSEAFGNMDWQTWLVGISFEAGEPHLAVLLHFAWEP